MKKGLILGGLALGGIAAYRTGKKKLEEFKEILDNLKPSLYKIRDVNISGGKTTVVLDLALTNNTDHKVSIDTHGFVTLDKVFVYDKNGSLVAEASTTITQIDLVPYGATIFENVIMQSGTVSLAMELLSEGWENGYQIQVGLKAFGKSWVVG